MAQDKPFTQYGYVPDGDDVPVEYLIRITSVRDNETVVALMQEGISMTTHSNWEPVVPMGMGNFESVTQAITSLAGSPTSLITKAASRRIWKGSSPILIVAKLKFEAVNDAFKEVAMPCKILQKLALPSEKDILGDTMQKFNISKSLPVLSPPGPTPFTTVGLLENLDSNPASTYHDAIKGMSGGNLIIVRIGTFISFINVIVKEVSINVEPKFTKEGYPISASVDMSFETYEMMTTRNIDRAYNAAKHGSSTEK